MSDNIDFKSLWNKQATNDIPDMKEVLAKAGRLKRKNRYKLVALNLVLLAAAALTIYEGFSIKNEAVTTKIGAVLLISAYISYLIAYNQMIPVLFKTNMEANSQEYLAQLLSIRRRLVFLNRVMINIYFVLLSVGLLLYSLQFARKMSVLWTIVYFVVTFGCMAFAWFYSRPRRMKKEQKALNEVIEKLEAVNEQLNSEQ
jgi:Flp pilus assembly protein TadB